MILLKDVSHIDINREVMKPETCPICNSSASKEFIPFCSKRCSQIDLNRWLGEKYQIRIADDDKNNN